MGWLRKSEDLAGRTDPVASWGERAAKLVLWIVGPSALSGLAVGAYGWVTANPLYGVTFGVVAFAVIQFALTLQAIRRSAARRGPFAEAEPEQAASSAPSPTDSEEFEQLKTKLRETEQEIGRLRREAVEDDQGVAYFGNAVVPDVASPGMVDMLKARIEELGAENERLRSQPGDEELKQRSFNLSDELFRFVRERDEKAPSEAALQMSGGLWDAIKESVADPKTQERTKYDNETRRQYSQQYAGNVGALLDALEQRRWLDTEERNDLEEGIENPLFSPTARMRKMAQRLAAIGKRLDGSTDLPNGQLSDEDLKERCRELAEDFHEFLEDYGWDEVARAEARDAGLDYEIAHADQETMRQFRKRLKPRVMGMLAELKRRGWWKQEDFDLPDREAVESPAHPHDLQSIADRLERLGYGPWWSHKA